MRTIGNGAWGEDSSQDQPVPPEEQDAYDAAFGITPGRGRQVTATPLRSMPTVRSSDMGKQNHTGWVTQMNDDDLKNDAIDAQIQAAIGQARGNTLQGMTQAPGVPPMGTSDNDADDMTVQSMQAEDDAEEAKKKQGGGGLGGLVSGVASMFGGG
jgi:hypothetical protein